MSKKTAKKSFDLLRRLMRVPSKTFRCDPEKEEKKAKELLGGGPPMKKILDWFKENKSWMSIWILILIIIGMLSTCSELSVKIEYHYKISPVVQKYLDNIK